jgi:hypothetical protein
MTNPLEPEPQDFTQQEEQDDVAKITSLIHELDLVGGTARIWRQPPGDSKFSYWGEIPVDNFSLEHVRIKYGGGDYQIRFAAKGGKYVRSIKFSVDPSFVGEIIQQQLAKNAPPTPATPHGPDDRMLTYMMQQSESARQQNAAMMTLMVTMMSKSQESMAAVIGAALSGSRTPPPSDNSRMIDLMQPLLVEGLKPRGSGLSELVETVKVVRELAGEPKESEPKEDDMLGKIAGLAGPLMAAWMSRPQQQPQQPQMPRPMPGPMPVPGSPSGAPQLPPTPQPNPAEAAVLAKAQELVGKVRMVTPYLIGAASKNAPVETYAAMLDDMVDQQSFDLLCQLLEQPDWVKIFFNDDPNVLQHIGWFNSLRDVILDESEAPAPGEGEDTGAVPGSGVPPVDRPQ